MDTFVFRDGIWSSVTCWKIFWETSVAQNSRTLLRDSWGQQLGMAGGFPRDYLDLKQSMVFIGCCIQSLCFVAHGFSFVKWELHWPKAHSLLCCFWPSVNPLLQLHLRVWIRFLSSYCFSYSFSFRVISIFSNVPSFQSFPWLLSHLGSWCDHQTERHVERYVSL